MEVGGVDLDLYRVLVLQEGSRGILVQIFISFMSFANSTVFEDKYFAKDMDHPCQLASDMSTFCFSNDLDHFSFTASCMGDNLIKTFFVNPDTPTQPISCKQAVLF